jgi:hypothetical protein
MYIGVQRPADCSPVRPKIREEAVQRNRDEAIQRYREEEQRKREEAAKAPDRQSEEAAKREMLIRDEVARRMIRKQGTEGSASGAELLLWAMCEPYKNYKLSEMPAAVSAKCYRFWSGR